MKITFAKAIVVFLAFSLLSAHSFSQVISSAAITTEMAPGISSNPDPSNQMKIASTEVVSKALKCFADYFNDVAGVTWWKQVKEYMAEFRKDGKWVKAYFTAKGNFISSFAITDEEHLPDDIHSQIEMVYRKYKITTATEIFMNNSTTWFVNLENDKRMLIVDFYKPSAFLL